MTTTDSLSGTVATESNIRTIQKEPNFFRYVGGTQGATTRKSGPKGKNENPPHDAIHGAVGGHLWGPDAAFDPVFWTHHCMIDCLWYDWNLNRGHPNTNNSTWLNARLNTAGSDPKFVDSDGNTIDKIEVVETVLMPLAYEYEACIPAEEPTPVADPEGFLEQGANVELRVVEEFRLREEVRVEIERPINIPTDIEIDGIEPFLTREKEGRFLVQLRDIDPPAYPANLRTRVFVNRPEVTPEATVDDPRFVDHIPFFVAPEGQSNTDLFVDVTETLRRLYDADGLTEDGQLSFQLVSVPTGQLRTEGSYTIGRLDLEITRSFIDGEVAEY